MTEVKSIRLLPGLALNYMKLDQLKPKTMLFLGNQEHATWTYGIGGIYFYHSDPEIRIKFSTLTRALEVKVWRFCFFIAFPRKEKQLCVESR